MSSIAELKDNSGAVIYPQTTWNAILNKPDLSQVTVAVPATSYVAAGNMPLRRWGPFVIATVQLQFTAGAQWKNVVPITSIPDGYHWTDEVSASTIIGSSSVAGKFVYLYMNSQGIQAITSDTTAVGTVQGALWWLTNEAVPAK